MSAASTARPVRASRLSAIRRRAGSVRDDGPVSDVESVGDNTDAEEDATAGPPRGRPRSIEADRAILRAAAELLEEDGFERMTMEAVAQRAGVSKATLYRRWSNKVDLVVDVVTLGFKRYPISDTGDTKEDLLEMARRSVAIIEGRIGRIMTAVASEARRNETLAEAVRVSLLEPRREALRTVVRRGIERGDIRADVDPDLVLDALVGAIFYRSESATHPPTVEDAEALVDLLFRGMSTS